MDLTTTGLASRLKEETRALHTLAERSGVMADLMQGRISRETYCLLLRNLHAIYAALEAGLDAHQADPNVQRIWRPELRRLPALEQDLDHLHTGTNWRDELPVLAAAATYAERLHQPLASHPPAPEPAALRLLPHAYLRYLGDLHGGQMLARIVRQRFALPGPQENAGPPQVFLTPSGGLATEGRQVWERSQGTAFYAFGEDLQRVEQLKRDFRAGLNALVLTPLQADAFVAEACEGFRLHGCLFEALQGDHWPVPGGALQP